MTPLLYMKGRCFMYGIKTPWMNSPIGVEAPDFNSRIRNWRVSWAFHKIKKAVYKISLRTMEHISG